MYTPWASKASFWRASTLYKCRGPKSGFTTGPLQAWLAASVEAQGSRTCEQWTYIMMKSHKRIRMINGVNQTDIVLMIWPNSVTHRSLSNPFFWQRMIDALAETCLEESDVLTSAGVDGSLGAAPLPCQLHSKLLHLTGQEKMFE